MTIAKFLPVLSLALFVSAAPAAWAAEASDKAFKKLCTVCHTVEAGKNKVGPSLAGIVGRKAGTIAGFRYSEANQKSDVVWDEAKLEIYLEDPKKFMPGNKMVFNGVKNADERKEIVAYLKAAK